MVGALLWARAEVRDGWRSLIVVGALVSVVVGSVLALLSGASRAGSAPERFAANSDLAEIVVFIGDRPPNGLVQEIAGDPRVERLSVSRVVRIAAGAPAGPDTNGIIGVDDPRGGFGRPHLVSGRYPTAGSTDEILVGERGARSAGIALGDRLPVTALPCLECERDVDRRGQRRRDRPADRGPRRRPSPPVDDPRRTDAPGRPLARGRAAGDDPVVARGRRRRPPDPHGRPLDAASGRSATCRTKRSTPKPCSGQPRCSATRSTSSPPSPPPRARSSSPRRSPATCSGVPATHPPSRPSGWTDVGGRALG